MNRKKNDLPGYKDMVGLMNENPRMAYSFIQNISRAALQNQLGLQYGTDRDMFKALGYKHDPTFADFLNMYERVGIAKRIVQTWPKTCWKAAPIVKDSGGDGKNPTTFEEEWQALVSDRKVLKYLKNADIRSGIGKYAVIIKGYDGEGKLSEEITTASELIYMRVVDECNAKVHSYVKDTNDPRYGLPEVYKVSLPRPTSAQVKEGDSASGKQETKQASKEHLVHWTRVQHIAEGAETNDVFGTERLKVVYNDLFDWIKVTGGSAEMFWRGALAGWAFVADKDVDMSEPDLENMQNEIESWIHGLDRYMRLQGVEPKALDTQVHDPKGHQDAVLNDMAAATWIPKRKLIGSERGELSSNQDESDFNDEAEARRDGYVTEEILRVFIDDCIAKGIISKPKGGKYSVEWPSLRKTSEKEEAEVALAITKAIGEYIKSGAVAYMPPEIYFVEVLGWDPMRVEAITKMLNGAQDEEDDDFDGPDTEEDMNDE